MKKEEYVAIMVPAQEGESTMVEARYWRGGQGVSFILHWDRKARQANPVVFGRPTAFGTQDRIYIDAHSMDRIAEWWQTLDR